MVTPHSAGRRGSALAALAILAALVALLAPAAPAAAHAEVVSSDPADGQTVSGPLSRAVLTFSESVSPTAAGFTIRDGSGRSRNPDHVATQRGTDVTLTFDPALAAGSYDMQWRLGGADGHPVTGSLRFLVGGPGVPAPPAALAAPTIPEPGAARSGGESGAGASFLGWVGRSLLLGGTILGIGAISALLWVIRGRPGELLAVTAWVRVAGLAVVLGSAVDLISLALGPTAGGWDLVTSNAFVADLQRLAGGAAVVAGFSPRAQTITLTAQSRPSRRLIAVGAHQQADASGSGPGAPEGPERAVAPNPVGSGPAAPLAWSPSGRALLGLAGLCMVLGSFWFDGHTVGRGPWALHATANVVHVVAAGIWAGGVMTLTALVWRRHMHGRPGDSAWLVVRFSSVAAAALAAVALAGVAMAAMVLDVPSQLWDTTWGRVLLAKTVVVTVAVALGAHNHVRLRPALLSDPDSPGLAARVRRTLAVEAAAVCLVVLLTAGLVAAAT